MKHLIEYPLWRLFNRIYLFIPLFLLFVAFIFAAATFSRVSYTPSDPRYTLLVSQAIVEEGTIKLNAYEERANLNRDDLNLVVVDEDLYYYFPLGSSVLSAPIVWAANRFLQLDMANFGHESMVQVILSAVTTVLIFWLAWGIARLYLDRLFSLLLAGTTVLGTVWISALGTALWNFNYEILAMLAGLRIMMWRGKNIRGGNHPVRSVLLGFLLFVAFFARPTAAFFIAGVLIYLFLRDQEFFWPAAMTACVLLLIWVGFNFAEYGTLLSPYYSVSRVGNDTTSISTALYGHLFSPSRGLFVFSPFLILVPIGALVYIRELGRNSLFWLALIWFVVHLAVILLGGNFPWWGGDSYGPRLLADAIIPLYLILVLLFAHLFEENNAWESNLFVSLLIVLGGIAFMIHSVQGLYNGNTARWSGALLEPSPGTENSYLFDWRYPQFLATKSSLCNRHRSYFEAQWLETELEPVEIGQFVSYNGDRQLFYIGWSVPNAAGRWTECALPEIRFVPNLETYIDGQPIELLIDVRTDAVPKSFLIYFNGELIDQFEIQADAAGETVTLVIPASEEDFLAGDTNTLLFDVPGLDSLIGDPHLIGFQFEGLTISSENTGR